MIETQPQMLTVGRIAHAVNAPLHRVLRILATRPHIRPAARAGTLRLYEHKAIAQVRDELAAMDARRHSEKGVRNGK